MNIGDEEKREMFYREIECTLDWDTYDGTSCENCLLGQVAQMNDVWSNIVGGLSYMYDIDRGILQTIYDRASIEPFAHDVGAALDMAWQTLGLNGR